jgi:hypothetical protein
MENQGIKAVVKIELEDYLDFTKILRNKQQVRIYIALIIGAIVMAIIGDKITALLAILYFLLVYVGGGIWYKNHDKKIYESNKLIKREIEYMFSDDTIDISSPDGNSRVKWNDLYGMRQSKNTILLMTSKASALIIPKRLLSTEEVAELENLIKVQLGEKASEKTNPVKMAFSIIFYFALASISVAIALFFIKGF